MAQSNFSRRDFVKATTSAGVAASMMTAASQARAAGASERLRIGVIGAGNRGFNTLTKKLVELRKLGRNLDLVSVADVYSVHRERFVDYVKEQTGVTPSAHIDYRELLQEPELDAVVIATPDHWHAKITLDAFAAGKHVYCEKPMTHTVDEGRQVVDAWKSSGKVMQVGVQSSSSPVWEMARELIDAGKLGKVLQFQTESARNSSVGMSRHNKITKEMTPKTVDFRRFLGVDEGFHPEVPFDREIFGQWRCYWAFGYGMYSDLFVHRVTGMLKATGLRMPGRVVGGGGIFLEYDDREVTDVASIIADFHEGVQGLVSSTMVSEERKLDHIIRGHHGLLLFDKSCYLNGPKASFQYIPERPQVTLDSSLSEQSYETATELDFVLEHCANWIQAIETGKPGIVNNDPELAAAAVMMVNLAVRSYREGKVFHVDRQGNVSDGNSSWADNWEKMSRAKAKPLHVPGWHAGETGSVLHPPEYQQLAGPWVDGKPPGTT
ncbi:MAG: Gfo/Idh/MocA family oxidoreductase [Planctomycetaceae bacterium]|nr:Gfo/Idh/MocA family oxidoreductase [Planctomycetaceae bacterium]